MKHGSLQEIPKAGTRTIGRRLQLNNVVSLAACFSSWELEFCQLESGHLETTLSQVDQPGFHLGRLRANQSLEIVGRSPAARHTLIVCSQPAGHYSWSGRPMSADRVLVLPPGESIQAVTPGGCDLLAISMTEMNFSRMLPARMGRYIRSSGPWILRNADLTRIRQALIRMDQAVSNNAAPPRDLATEMAAGLASAMGQKPQRLRRRDEGLLEARRLIGKHAGQDLSIESLCETVGVSHRTLLYAFREHYGLAPKRFLVIYRLNGVRRDFYRLGGQGVKIIDVASHWGFWHMGQFASDYRRLFGELPSATLNDLTNNHSDEDAIRNSHDSSPHLGWTSLRTPSWGQA